MASTIISNMPQYTFGQLTNRMTSGLIQANTAINRLGDAIATASSGYDGAPGTQFEVPATMAGNPSNLFGVVADANAPGAKGQDYSYAVSQLKVLWTTFWKDAEAYVQQLDNGTM